MTHLPETNMPSNQPLGRLPIRIYWEDTDAGGIVYHANYLKYMERARSELMDALGGVAQQALCDEGVLFVVADAELKFRRAALLGDRLEVRTRITQLKHASLVFEQLVMRGEELLVEGRVRVGVLQRRTMRPCVMPDAVYQRVAALLNERDA